MTTQVLLSKVSKATFGSLCSSKEIYSIKKVSLRASLFGIFLCVGRLARQKGTKNQYSSLLVEFPKLIM